MTESQNTMTKEVIALRDLRPNYEIYLRKKQRESTSSKMKIERDGSEISERS